MGVLLRKHRGVYSVTKISKLAFVGFLTAFAISLENTIWSVYLDSFVNSALIVGLIISSLTVLALASYFIFIPLIEKSDKAKLYLIVLFLLSLSYFLLYSFTNLSVILIIAVIIAMLSSLRMTSYGILIKDFSSKTKLSRNEGLVFTFANSAWIIGPLIAGYIAFHYGNRKVFLLGAVFLLLAFLVFRIFHFKDFKIKKKADKSIIKNFKDFFKDRKRILAYVLGGGITAWWTLVYVYMPILIIRSGLNSGWVGYFLFGVALPLIALEYYFSKIAGKQGFRKMFILGYGSVALLSLIAFFAFSDIYLVMFIIAFASIGMAIIEPVTEAYFFDILKGKDLYRFYGPYNTCIDLGYLFGNISAAVLLFFLPFKFLFILFSLWMFLLFFLSFKTRNIIENKKQLKKSGKN